MFDKLKVACGWGDYSDYAPYELSIRDKSHKVAMFGSQLSSMVNSGVPLIRAIDVIGEQSEDRKFGFIVDQVQIKISQGYTFSKALSLYTKIFPPVFVHLVSAGENSGRLAKVLERLSHLLDRENHLRHQIRGALGYPVFVLILTAVLTVGLFTTVLPSFADFYKDFDIELPLVTSTIIGLTHACQSPWFWVCVVLIGGILIWIARRSWRTPHHKLALYRVLNAMPLLGKILLLSSLARYCWVLDLTLSSGMGLLRSLKLAGMSSGHPLLETDANRLITGVTNGESVSELLAFRPEIYPGVMLQMVRMGDETSTVSDACGRLGQWFEADVEGRIQAFQAALEPILMTIVSVVVGTIVIAVFLPLYGLLEKLGSG